MQYNIDELKQHIEQCNILLSNMIEQELKQSRAFDKLKQDFDKLNHTSDVKHNTEIANKEEKQEVESDVRLEIVQRLESNRVYSVDTCTECTHDMNHEWYIVCDRKQYLNEDGSERKWLMYACYNCGKWGDDNVMANNIALGI